MSQVKEKTKPVRIQRKRTKGFKLISPNGLENVYVGRPTYFANGYKIGHIYRDGTLTREKALLLYEKDINESLPLKLKIKEKLKGKNLVCWCSLDVPCHADILLRIANEV